MKNLLHAIQQAKDTTFWTLLEEKKITMESLRAWFGFLLRSQEHPPLARLYGACCYVGLLLLKGMTFQLFDAQVFQAVPSLVRELHTQQGLFDRKEAEKRAIMQAVCALCQDLCTLFSTSLSNTFRSDLIEHTIREMVETASVSTRCGHNR